MANYLRNRNGGIRKRRLLLRKKMKGFRSGDVRKKGKDGNYSFDPQWKGAIEGYTVRTLHKNSWRFSNCMAFEDAYQEAYVKFLELQAKYSGLVDSPKWFMSLFKTALENKITDFANLNNRLKRQVCFTELGDQLSADGEKVSYQETLIGLADNEGKLDVKINDAPDYVRKVLILLLTGPPDLLAAMADTWDARGKRKHGGNEFLCNMLGYDSKQVDLVEAVKDYLEEVT